jgi:hypothetical protein
LRILTNEVGGGSISGATNATWQLRRSINGAAFANVTSASTGVLANTASALTDGGATTNRLTAIGTFSAGQQDDQNGAVTYTHPANNCTEHVFGLTLVAADLADGDVVTFDLLYNGASFTTTQNGSYNVVPTLNITKPVLSSGVGTATGVGVAAAPGVEVLSGVGTAAGVGTTTAEGATAGGGVSAGDGTALGVGTASAPGVEVLGGAGTAAGAGSAAAVGSTATIATGVGTAVATGAASAGGAVLTPYLPNAVLAVTNLKDTSANNPPTDLTDIQDDPDSPDGDWWTAVNPTANTQARLGLQTPDGNLVTAQAFELYLRKTAGAGDPTVDVDLYEGGSLVQNLVSGVSITSTTGQKVTVPWDASLLADPSGAGAEIRITGTAT